MVGLTLIMVALAVLLCVATVIMFHFKVFEIMPLPVLIMVVLVIVSIEHGVITAQYDIARGKVVCDLDEYSEVKCETQGEDE